MRVGGSREGVGSIFVLLGEGFVVGSIVWGVVMASRCRASGLVVIAIVS